ncbi:MAG: leucine-rich repeat domain-containing protein [Verrucomicrobiota bacterium]|jgi:hypothetical protein
MHSPGTSWIQACPNITVSLTNATICSGVTSIGPDAFDACTSLTSITIPSSVNNIGRYAFEGCPELASIYFTGNAPTTNLNVFEDDNATVYYLPGATGWSGSFDGRPAMLWNPAIQTADGSFGVSNNHFGFNVTGTTNIPIVVEACTNLANSVWTSLRTLTLTNGSIYFSDFKWTNYPCRYYRIAAP